MYLCQQKQKVVSRGFFAATLIASLICCKIGAQEFHVSGTLEGQRLFEKTVTGNIPSTQFDISVSGSNWLIHIEPGMFGGYLEAGYDGDAVRVVAAGYHGQPSATVGNSEIPRTGADPRIGILWVAFAQSCYLQKSIPSEDLVPAFLPGLFQKPIPTTVERLNGNDRFPSRIVYFSDGTNRLNNVAEPMRYPRPFQNGFTNAIFTVLAFTNIGAFRIPLEFELNVFQPAAVRPVSSNNISLGLHCVGKVLTADSVSAVSNFSPVLPDNQLSVVKDGRFLTPGRGYTEMLYKTNRWLTKQDVQEMPAFNVYTQQEVLTAKFGIPAPTTKDQIREGTPPSRSRPMMILIGLATTAALITFFRRSAHSNKTSNQER